MDYPASITATENIVNENYNGLVASIRRRFTKYLGFTANYTWSKALGYYPFNPIDIKADYGVGGNSLAYGQDQSGEDRASIFNVGYTAVIPYGHGMLFGWRQSEHCKRCARWVGVRVAFGLWLQVCHLRLSFPAIHRSMLISAKCLTV